MKILVLSDLHFLDRSYSYEKEQWLIKLKKDYNPDLVLITGDIFESHVYQNPYETLAEIFDNIPTICTLGNHEFTDKTIDETHNFYGGLYRPEKWNVHYLDIVGNSTFENVYFFGNVLWYDGSTKTMQNQIISDYSAYGWLDGRIKNFDYKVENEKCVKQLQINSPQPNTHCTSIMCTHHCPHKEMNGWLFNGDISPYNAYSGLINFPKNLHFDWVISGHTHFRRKGKLEYEGREINYLNVGNDYYKPWSFEILEF